MELMTTQMMIGKPTYDMKKLPNWFKIIVVIVVVVIGYKYGYEIGYAITNWFLDLLNF